MKEINTKYTNAKRALFDKVFGERLNPEQCRAVFSVRGPLLVLAGAGSGKTTVLVNRIAYILRYGNAYFSETVPEGVTEETVQALEEAAALTAEEIEEILPGFITEPCPPWSVLAITFTNKAANEIKARLAASLGDGEAAESIWAGTFHSMCLRILRRHGERIGYSPTSPIHDEAGNVIGERGGITIYDADDSKRLISDCMKELEIDEKRLSPKIVANLISRAKDKLLEPDGLDDDNDPRLHDVARVYRLYSEKLMASNAVDFDDIIMKTVLLLKTCPDVLQYYQNKFRYVLVDEYQDTNHAQFVLTSLLSGKYRNIMVVGDDDQSIYRFRGATVENILSFDKEYPDATVIKLEQNYRSTETILDAANAVISHNSEHRHQKSLWSNNGRGDKITLRALGDQNEEGRYIIDRISKAVKNDGRRYSDFAVLYRINELARTLETTFAKSGVPYRILGGMRFYDRKEIRDMIAYLSVIASDADALRLKRIINEPKRKIGDKAIESIEALAAAEGTTMLSVMRRAGEYVALKRVESSLVAFAKMIDGIRESGAAPSAMIGRVFEESGYHEMLLAEGFIGEGKINNINELISGAMEYEKRCEESDTVPTLSGYLEDIALVADVDKYDESADAVVLMTIHSAKGLEFPIVFLAGMEDGIFPSDKNMGDTAEMCEERRLCYVALTRAKEKVYVTHTESRMMYGRTARNMLSVFVREEIPEELIANESPRREPPRMPPSYFDPFSPRGAVPRFGGRGGNTGSTRSSSGTDFGGSGMFKSTPKKTTAASFGIEKLEPGTRVSHAIFGSGTVKSARDLGGDVLYEISFDSGAEKKLMATYAKLEKLNK